MDCIDYMVGCGVDDIFCLGKKWPATLSLFSSPSPPHPPNLLSNLRCVYYRYGGWWVTIWCEPWGQWQPLLEPVEWPMRAHLRDVMSCHDHTFLDWSDNMFSKTLNGSSQVIRRGEPKIPSEIPSPIAVYCPTNLCCTVLHCIALYCIVLYYAFMAGCGWLAARQNSSKLIGMALCC